MFIAQVPEKIALALEEPNTPVCESKHFAPPELQSSLGFFFYEHLISPGPKTSATEK
jgi:hypothetical protein